MPTGSSKRFSSGSSRVSPGTASTPSSTVDAQAPQHQGALHLPSRRRTPRGRSPRGDHRDHRRVLLAEPRPRCDARHARILLARLLDHCLCPSRIPQGVRRRRREAAPQAGPRPADGRVGEADVRYGGARQQPARNRHGAERRGLHHGAGLPLGDDLHPQDPPERGVHRDPHLGAECERRTPAGTRRGRVPGDCLAGTGSTACGSNFSRRRPT